MKTVVQKLINKVDAMISNGGDADLLAVKVHLENSLEAEKEQIMEAYEAGHLDGYELGKYNEDEIYPNSSYYQQTYNQEQ